MDAVEPTLLPSEPLKAAIRYYKNNGDALFRFVDDPIVPIDNSPTEREFQNVAKLRLNMLFAGSTEGAHRACVLLGIVATCRAQGVPARAYLTWAFDRLGTHRDLFALPLEQMPPRGLQKDARLTDVTARLRERRIPASLMGHGLLTTRLDVRETHEFGAGRSLSARGDGAAPSSHAQPGAPARRVRRHEERARAIVQAGGAREGRAIHRCAQSAADHRRGAGRGLSADAKPNQVPARPAEPPATAFARRFAYGLGLSHALSERLDDARLPLGAALELAQTPRQRAMVLGAIAMVASKQGRTDETFTVAASADAAAHEAGMAPPVAKQRVRGEVLAATWRLAEAAPLFLDAASRSPLDDSAWATAAVTFGGAGDAFGALEALRRGLAVQPRGGVPGARGSPGRAPGPRGDGGGVPRAPHPRRRPWHPRQVLGEGPGLRERARAGARPWDASEVVEPCSRRRCAACSTRGITNRATPALARSNGLPCRASS